LSSQAANAATKTTVAPEFNAEPKEQIDIDDSPAFEHWAKTVAAFFRIAMIRIMLRRLAANTSS
jgi:hypothetical protein